MSENSFKLKVEQSLNIVFIDYIQQISLKYDISYDELLSLWNGNGNIESVEKKDDCNVEKKDDCNVEKKDDCNVEKKDDELEPEKILKATKPELVAMCKMKGLKYNGTKNDLISRLVSKPVTQKLKKKKKEVRSPQVIKKINASIPAIQIKKNKFGNYEHSDTGLIFDKNSKKVIGKQHSDGQLIELSHSDIDLCNKYKFSYNLPENLNKKSTLDDIQIDDLDSDDEDNKNNVENEDENDEDENDEDENDENDEDENDENDENDEDENDEDDVDLEEFYDD